MNNTVQWRNKKDWKLSIKTRPNDGQEREGSKGEQGLKKRGKSRIMILDDMKEGDSSEEEQNGKRKVSEEKDGKKTKAEKTKD